MIHLLIIAMDYGLIIRKLIMRLWVAALASFLLWARCARICTTRLRMRAGTLALPFLVNHLHRKGELRA